MSTPTVDQIDQIDEILEQYYADLADKETALLRTLYPYFLRALGEVFQRAGESKGRGTFFLGDHPSYTGSQWKDIKGMVQDMPPRVVASLLCVLSECREVAPHQIRPFDLGVESVAVHWERREGTIVAQFYRTGWKELLASEGVLGVKYDPPFLTLLPASECASEDTMESSC